MNILRNEKGTMIAHLTPKLLNMILEEADGRWTLKEFKSGEKKSCFVFNSDASLTLNNNKIYIWEGYYIEGGLAG